MKEYLRIVVTGRGELSIVDSDYVAFHVELPGSRYMWDVCCLLQSQHVPKGLQMRGHIIHQESPRYDDSNTRCATYSERTPTSSKSLRENKMNQTC